MPNGARVALTASCTYMDRQFKPDFGVQLEFGGETNTPVGTSQAVLVGNTFDVQQRIKLFKGLGVEVGHTCLVSTFFSVRFVYAISCCVIFHSNS